jgi:HK97 family phage major capsid protein
VILVSRELIEHARNVAELITHSLTEATALEVDRAALLGDGTNNSPVGLANIAGVRSTAGAAISDYSHFVASIGRLMANNVQPTAFITNPQVRIKCDGLQDTPNSLSAPGVMQDVPSKAWQLWFDGLRC